MFSIHSRDDAMSLGASPFELLLPSTWRSKVPFSIRSHTSFRGPNVWHRSAVTHLVIDADPERDAICDVPGLADSYVTFAALMPEGTPLTPLAIEGPASVGAILAQLAVNLQRLAGVAVDFSFSQKRPGDRGFDVVVQHRHPSTGLVAAQLAVRWLSHLLDGDEPAFDAIEAFARFTIVVESNDHGAVGRAFANAAERRGIPQTVVDPRGRVREFGNGRYRKRMVGASTSLTSLIGAEISRDKHLTNHYLREAGLPVPESIVVRSLGEALAAARAIGYPVVIKPIDLASFMGVVLDLRNEAELRESFAFVADAASKASGKMLVERFIQGNDYRAQVVNDRIVAISQRLPPRITGDGTHTIRQLVDIENADPRRGARASSFFKPIIVDNRVLLNLARLELGLDDVPAAGQQINLKASGPRREGAFHLVVTGAIHPENAALLRSAARLIGLDIAGIDFITPDIAQPIRETGGAIIEINDTPGFNPHLFPGAGPIRDPGPAIMEMLFPPGQPVRVPLVAVTAGRESDALCKVIARMLTLTGLASGLATSDGLVVDGMSYAGVEARNPTGPRTLLNNPMVEAAVVEVDAQSIVEHGLGFDPCDVVVILSLSGLKTPFGQPVETVLLGALDPAGVVVLDAADPEIRALATEIGAPVILVNFRKDDPGHAALLEGGQRAVVPRVSPTGTLLSLTMHGGRHGSAAIELPEASETTVLSLISSEILQIAVAVVAGLNFAPEDIQACLRSLVIPA